MAWPHRPTPVLPPTLLTQSKQQDLNCPLVLLTNSDPDAYALKADIKVTHYVRVMGIPAVLPTIDASGTTRAFTILAGGFLELKFVRIKRGGGITRNRYGLEGLHLASQVTEIRGGAVSVEPGAMGANFSGVVFLAVATSANSVQKAVEDTLNFMGGRVYGGHVFVASGTVNFFGCRFIDKSIVLPLTDQIAIGGDVLVVGGHVFFTGCAFSAARAFGGYSGLGMQVAALGGHLVMTYCTIESVSVAAIADGAGHALFISDGTMVLTGVDFRFAAATLLFTGMGDVFACNGLLILTGVTIENTYPILAAYGAGQRLALGGGVAIESGVSYTQATAAAHQSLVGASVFTGDGTSLHLGVPTHLYSFTSLFTGQGGHAYNAAGYSMWLGCPLAAFSAVVAFFGMGGLTSQTAGFTVYIGNPAFTPAVVSSFVGAGVVGYLGMGGAVIGSSNVYAPAYIFRGAAAPGGAAANYYVTGQSVST
jgi:hypothetical protein